MNAGTFRVYGESEEYNIMAYYDEIILKRIMKNWAINNIVPESNLLENENELTRYESRDKDCGAGVYICMYENTSESKIYSVDFKID